MRTRGPLPVAGAAVAVAAIGGITLRTTFPGAVAVGASGIAVVCGLPRLSAPWAVSLASPFAWLIAVDASDTSWIRAAVLVSASLGAVACSRSDEVWTTEAVGPALLFISAVGVFLAVPDTEEARVLVGATALAAVVGWPLRIATLGRAGAGASCAVLAWVVAVGGRGRTPSIAGGLACLGVLVWLVAAPWVRTRFHRGVPSLGLIGDRQILVLLALQGLVVLVASRVAGISNDLPFAVVVATASGVMAFFGSMLIGPPAGDRPD